MLGGIYLDTIKRVADSLTEQTVMLMPKDLNGQLRLFGGQLVSWIDVVAGIVARRHSNHIVVTAAIDNLQFKAGASAGDILVLIGKMTYVGSTSMEVRVDTYVELLDGTRKTINRAYLVMVAVDDQGHPVKVPGLEVITESEKAEWEGGKKRSILRKQRRMEGF